jgi:hypothetical protein
MNMKSGKIATAAKKAKTKRIIITVINDSESLSLDSETDRKTLISKLNKALT